MLFGAMGWKKARGALIPLDCKHPYEGREYVLIRKYQTSSRFIPSCAEGIGRDRSRR